MLMRAAPDQLSLPGFPTRPTNRLFFALRPDLPAARRAVGVAEGLSRQHDLKPDYVGLRRLHVSLHGLGEYDGVPSDLVARVREAAALVAAEPFEVAFDRVESFNSRRKRPLVLRTRDDGPLVELYWSLARALAEVGLGRGNGARFTPHMTLFYDWRAFEEQAVETIAWTVRDFVLIDSLIGRKRHTPVAFWPLRKGSQ